MMETVKTPNQGLLKYTVLYLLIIGIIATSFVIMFFQSNITISTAPLLLISTWCCLETVIKNKLNPHGYLNIEKWACLFLGIALIFFSILFGTESNWILSVSLFFCLISVISYLAGRRIFAKTLIPIAVLVILLPQYEYIYYWLGLPIRLICTKLTVIILSVFGMNITSDATVLSLGNDKLAITAACSGLVLLEMMTWIGWLVVLFLYKTFWKKVIHYIMIFPIVLFTNTIRLCILASLFSFYGEAAIVSPIHIWTGYAMVVFASIIFYYCKYFVKDNTTND